MNINTLYALVTLWPVGDEISAEDLADTLGVSVPEYQKFAKAIRREYADRSKAGEIRTEKVNLSDTEAKRIAKEMIG